MIPSRLIHSYSSFCSIGGGAATSNAISRGKGDAKSNAITDSGNAVANSVAGGGAGGGAAADSGPKIIGPDTKFQQITMGNAFNKMFG